MTPEENQYAEMMQAVFTDYAKIISLVKVRAQQLHEFDGWLRENTAWLDAPASSQLKFHSCFQGGLVVHSVTVTKTLLKLRKTLAPDISMESCAIVGLYHDVGKVGTKEHPMYIPEVRKWQRETLGYRYKVNDEGVFLDVPTRSLAYIMPMIGLDEEEIQAIRYHDGQYCDENHCVKNKEARLTRLLHMADSWAAGVLEKVPL